MIRCVASLPLPISGPSNPDSFQSFDWVLSQIVSTLDGCAFEDEPFKGLVASVSVDEGGAYEHSSSVWSKDPVRILRVSYDIPAEYLARTGDWQWELHKYGFATARFLNNIIIAANVADPGSLDTAEGVVLFDDGPSVTIPVLRNHPISEGRGAASSSGWPRLLDLPFDKVWRWLNRQAGFRLGFSDDSTSRALLSFANLLASADVMQLFWTMIGLEALFTDYQNEIRRQLRGNIQALLGPNRDFFLKLNSMYALRSDLIHGKLNFPAPMPAPTDRMMGFYNNLYETVAIASAVLVSSFQRMVDNGWDMITFDELKRVIGTQKPNA